jgi:hypothetical protein
MCRVDVVREPCLVTELHLTVAAVVVLRVPVLHMGFEHFFIVKLLIAFVTREKIEKIIRREINFPDSCLLSPPAVS